MPDEWVDPDCESSPLFYRDVLQFSRERDNRRWYCPARRVASQTMYSHAPIPRSLRPAVTQEVVQRLERHTDFPKRTISKLFARATEGVDGGGIGDRESDGSGGTASA